MKKIKEIKKEFEKIWGDKLKNTSMAKEVWSLFEHYFETTENEWEEVVKEYREMGDTSKKEALAKQKKEYDDYWG